MLPKPPSCSGCQLEKKGFGYAPPVGPTAAKILFVGEALGATEAKMGEPFYGNAGGMLDKILRLIEQERSWYRIDNVVRCMTPKMWLEGPPAAPWAPGAISHCSSRHLSQTLEKGEHKVVVPLGGTALRNVLQLPKKGIKVENFHGTVQRDPQDRFWVVPTFHPSHLQRGAHNLIGTVTFDISVALEVAAGTWKPQPIDLIMDPDIGWFEAWAENYLEALRQDPDVWLAVDIETPDKEKKQDEGELTSKDRSQTITRVNFSCNVDEGLTVPFAGPYKTVIRRLLAAGGVLIFWNAPYDVPRLRNNDCPPKGPVLDFMDAWHCLQSDIPRGLGFVAPFYSNFGAWKHLSGVDPVKYAAIDGPQTLRNAFGIAQELQDSGQWETVFWRHTYQLRKVAFDDGEQIGVKVDQPGLVKFGEELGEKIKGLMDDIQKVVPEEMKPLTPKKGLTSSIGEDGAPCIIKMKRQNQTVEVPGVVVSKLVSAMVNVCQTCNATEVVKKHRCKGEDGKPLKDARPLVMPQEMEVRRWFRRGPFNPASTQQKLEYVYARGHKPGKNKKTKKDSTDKESLKALFKKTKDPLYGFLLKIAVIAKVKGTYVDGTLRRLREDPRSQKDGRLHGQITQKPSTLRTSMVNPNLQNVVNRDSGGDDYSSGFRSCIVAADGCELVEADFAGIEAVETGWFCGDPGYIRLAKLGVHALVASHLIGKPADLKWSDADLGAYFKEIKKKYDKEYNQAKRCVHGKNYGLTVVGMVKQFPEEFPTKAIAEKVEDIYFSLAPALKKWQAQVRETANKQHYLGGPGAHPFGYKHRFFSVYSYTAISPAQYSLMKHKGFPVTIMNGRHYKIEWGEDSKRCVAFYPQSTAAGVIKESLLRLFTPGGESYIGDQFHGRSPFRLLIHDSIVLEVPKPRLDFVLERLAKEMLRPIQAQPCPAEWGIGSHLQIGIEVKAGPTWSKKDMRTVPTPTFENLGVAYDYMEPEILFDDEEDELSDDEAVASVLGLGEEVTA